ncbi:MULTISPECIES: BMP family lipoprotein [Caldisericum]|jgi:basic membrane protein A|uniref:BMP family ABC transporter substrate-binding protein n=2 Tax=Caldisericum TaxID=693074 RepID=A0A2J6WEE7_9BACT|nr:MAG: BMP family ABC transporter substrate-binding protein [Caldisericum exile]
MKKALLVLLAVVLLVSVVVAPGCKKTATTETQKKVKVTLYINGTLGDKSFFDSANRGLEMAIKDLGVDGKVIEGGYDPAKWQPDLEQLAQGDSDIIIIGTWQMVDAVTAVAPKHPEKKFIIFDTSVDYTKGNLGNVYSILYKQNEASFLVGALAAMITTSNMPLANKDKVIGFLGGMDIPVINDFKVGYIQGAHYIDPEVKVLVSYAGSFNDPAKGKELVLAQYDQGADISFNVAGETGLGLIDAAKEKNKYAIGVDSDQYIMLKDKDPEAASHIVTSMMKNVDKSIYRALKLYLEGKLEFGKAEALGLAEDGVGIADNENYQKLVPQEFRDKVNELAQKIIKGEIKVDTAFGS